MEQLTAALAQLQKGRAKHEHGHGQRSEDDGARLDIGQKAQWGSRAVISLYDAEMRQKMLRC
jgi:hypothetical protein